MTGSETDLLPVIQKIGVKKILPIFINTGRKSLPSTSITINYLNLQNKKKVDEFTKKG
ncbi:hypothetical protein TEHOK1_09480 [Tetragenococcus halophilus]|nr:hypothetical protein TEHOK1_09480 [Tetragenococcus halophilus]